MNREQPWNQRNPGCSWL